MIHYHAVIHRALRYAVKMDLLQANPADKIERPRKEKFVGKFYDRTEVSRLFSLLEGHLGDTHQAGSLLWPTA